MNLTDDVMIAQAARRALASRAPARVRPRTAAVDRASITRATESARNAFKEGHGVSSAMYPTMSTALQAMAQESTKSRIRSLPTYSSVCGCRPRGGIPYHRLGERRFRGSLGHRPSPRGVTFSVRRAVAFTFE